MKGFEPPDVKTAPAGARRAYWEAVSAYVAEAKESELKQRLDRFGNPMAPLAASTIKNRHSEMGPADPFGPPLQPAHGLSRTRSLFVAQPTRALDGVTCFWSYDALTGESWGEILRHHRAGGKHLPVRDVIGLSPVSLETVRTRALHWWRSYIHGVSEVPTPMKEIMPTPAPKFLVQREPANASPLAAKRVSQIRVNGATYTFQSGSAAQVRDAIAGGKFSGFRSYEELLAAQARRGTQYDPITRKVIFSFGTGPNQQAPPRRAPAPPKPPPPRPIPPAPTPLPHAATKAAAEKELGYRFKPAPVAQENPAYTTVVVDVAKVDAELARDPDKYVSPGGLGAAIKGRYEEFVRFLTRAKREDIAIEQPRAGLDAEDRITLGDGRHRFAVFRDMGAGVIPVSVRKASAWLMRKLYGARSDG